MNRLSWIPTLLAIALVTGCVTKAVQEKQEQLCTNLATLDTSIATLRRVGNSSTVSALKQAEEKVSAAFRDFKATAGDGQEVNIDNLETAYENLDKAVKDIPEQSTIAQAMTSISNQVTTVESSLTQVKSNLRCP